VVAESPWYRVGPLRRGAEYLVTLQLSDDEMSRLSGSGGSSGPTNF
jgi:hypothetical protein